MQNCLRLGDQVQGSEGLCTLNGHTKDNISENTDFLPSFQDEFFSQSLHQNEALFIRIKLLINKSN